MEYNYVMMPDGELYHWGIKGMKWGVRRYQNKDGTLTDAGKKRYDYESDRGGYNQTDENGVRYKVSKKGNVDTIKAEPARYAKEDNEALKNVVDQSKGLTNSVKSLNDFSIRQTKKNRPQMDLSNMTDQEMRNQINRALLEKQYNDMFAPQKVTKGREYVGDILEGAGAVLGVASSAVGLAVGIYTLREKMGV